MNKQEKYINYIVEDLVKKTEIDYDREEIISPFLPFFSPIASLLSLFLPYSFSSISKYVKDRYGTTDEEIQIIWGQYKQRIKSLINNG